MCNSKFSTTPGVWNDIVTNNDRIPYSLKILKTILRKEFHKQANLNKKNQTLSEKDICIYVCDYLKLIKKR